MTDNVVEFNPRGGPRTAAGRARSSRNALRHGLWSRSLLLPGEDEDAYCDFARGIIAELGATGAMELELAEHVIHAFWRLRRFRTYEVVKQRVRDAAADPKRRAVQDAQRRALTLERDFAIVARLYGGRASMTRTDMETVWLLVVDASRDASPEAKATYEAAYDLDEVFETIYQAGRLTAKKSRAVFAEMVAILQRVAPTNPSAPSPLLGVLHSRLEGDLADASATLVKAERDLQGEAANALLPVPVNTFDFHQAQDLDSIERRLAKEFERARRAFYEHRQAVASWSASGTGRSRHTARG